MELKWINESHSAHQLFSFNRTAYGIEMLF